MTFDLMESWMEGPEEEDPDGNGTDSPEDLSPVEAWVVDVWSVQGVDW